MLTFLEEISSFLKGKALSHVLPLIPLIYSLLLENQATLANDSKNFTVCFSSLFVSLFTHCVETIIADN